MSFTILYFDLVYNALPSTFTPNHILSSALYRSYRIACELDVLITKHPSTRSA